MFQLCMYDKQDERIEAALVICSRTVKNVLHEYDKPIGAVQGIFGAACKCLSASLHGPKQLTTDQVLGNHILVLAASNEQLQCQVC